MRTKLKSLLKSPLKSIVLIIGFAALTACVSAPKVVPVGTFMNGQSVQLNREWSDFSALTNSNKTKTKVLTIDGVLLNALMISDGLTEKEPLFIGSRGDPKDKPAPRPKAAMSLTEQMEYVGLCLAEMQFLRIETNSPKPVNFDGIKGIRFGISMETKEGLKMKGLAQAVNKGGKNYYIIYFAPSEHYYAATEQNVITAMDSAKLP